MKNLILALLAVVGLALLQATASAHGPVVVRSFGVHSYGVPVVQYAPVSISAFAVPATYSVRSYSTFGVTAFADPCSVPVSSLGYGSLGVSSYGYAPLGVSTFSYRPRVFVPRVFAPRARVFVLP